MGGYIMNTGLQATAATYTIPLQSLGKWRRLSSMPMFLTHVGQAIFRDRIYTAGGYAGQSPGRTVSDCFVFHFPSDKWSRLPNLPFPRAGGGLVYIQKIKALMFSSGMLRATGRYAGDDEADTWMLYLEHLEKGWQPRANIENPRNHMAAIAVGDKYFFLGGQHRNRESTENQATLQEYDYRGDKWIKRQDLPVPTGHIAASTFKFNKGFVFVGGINDGRILSDRIFYYNVEGDRWFDVGTFPRKVQSPVCGVAFKRLYCATGAGSGPANAVYTTRLFLLSLKAESGVY